MVEIKFKKKDLWLVSAVMIFVIAVGYVIAYNPSITGGQPDLMGHSADEIIIINNSWAVKTLQSAIDTGELKLRGAQGTAGKDGTNGVDGAQGPYGPPGPSSYCIDSIGGMIKNTMPGYCGCYNGWRLSNCVSSGSPNYYYTWSCCAPL